MAELKYVGKVKESKHLRLRWVVSRCNKNDKILDIGCAEGHTFRDTGFNVTLCDVNEFAIPNFICADAHDLPFEDNSFDICCLDEILEHATDPITVLKEAIRVCSKKVVFTVPNEWDWIPEYKPRMTIEERLKELGGITVKEMYLQDNPLCIKCNDPDQGFHHRWYKRETLVADIEQCKRPYKLDILNYGGWSHFIGEIYKDETAMDIHPLQQSLLVQITPEPMPAPSIIGHTKYDTLKQPKSLHLDTWAYCDAKCKFCRYPPMTRKKGGMDIKLLEHILDEASTWNIPLLEIVPIHYGEFFCNPNWYEVLKMMDKKLPKTRIILPTNGSLLDLEVVNKLATIQNLKIINISVNAFFAETYEELMGLKADTILRIKKAMQYISVLAPHITVWVSMVYDPLYQTEKEKALFIEEWKDKSYCQVHPASFCQDYREPVIRSRIPCRSIFIDFIILWDGRVVPCCWDVNGDIVVGDVNKQKILDIWHGKKMNNLRRLHNEGKRQELKLCSICSFS